MPYSVGETVSLRGISKKGKERVKNYGPDGWTVKQIEDYIDAFPGDKGPWLLLVPKFGETAQRWVHADRDRHFQVFETHANGLSTYVKNFKRDHRLVEE